MNLFQGNRANTTDAQSFSHQYSKLLLFHNCVHCCSDSSENGSSSAILFLVTLVQINGAFTLPENNTETDAETD